MPHSKEEVKSRLAEFIQRYQRHKSEGRLDKLAEENTKDYIDELFRILGWDIIDEVIKEYGTGKRKRVDYAFHIGGTTKFLLEAKAYREELEDRYVNQTLQYGYQNNKTWVVLSNLREIRIYNAKYFDQEEQIRQLFAPIKLENALERFDDLWLLSKEAMEHGLINQVATKYGKVRPREAIDKRIFEDLMEWRSLLTKNISKNNKFEGTPEEVGEKLDEAVQKILDRMIFVRVCEDRGLEEEGMLKWCITQKKNEAKYPLYNYMNRQFSKLNGVYNSGLFAEHFSEKLKMDDEVLEKIITHTYESHDGLQYDFSAIDADILGTVYEQYLGTLLKKTEKRATLKSEKAQRKKMGIYYTPTYIVDYIVKNTLGEKLKECKTPEEALKIKVLDPACGSGSFLIRAYDEFKHWFETYKAKNKKGVEQTILSLEDKKGLQTFMDRVLENCIYGVDLDTKAVELAQLNLLLKAAEDRHKLPKLDHTIRNGNSLIDDPAVAGRFAFKWEDKFPEVFRQGGFDVVIGNPPYINLETFQKNEKEYLTRYECFSGKSDILYYFYNKAIQLLKSDGRLGFITSRYFIEATYARNLRKYILDTCRLSKLLDLSSLPVFKDVGIHTAIIILDKTSDEKARSGNLVAYKEVSDAEEVGNKNLVMINQSGFGIDGWVLGSDQSINIFKKISSTNAVRLGDISIIEQGQKSGLNEAFTVDAETIAKNHLERQFIRKLVKNSYIQPYLIEDRGLYLIYASDELKPENAPNIIAYLAQFKDALKKRAEASEGLYPWYRLQRPRSKELFDQKEKIIVPYRAEKNKFGYDDQQRYNDGGDVRIIVIKDPRFSTKYVLAILNSNLMSYYYSFIGRKKGNSFEYFVEPLQKIPIANASKEKREQVTALVDRILLLSKRISEIKDKNSNEVQRANTEIQRIVAEIDLVIYEIYGMTEAEKKIIEESLK